MNIVETGLAFVEGLALIASPCILPVLPLILSASVEGGRKRPFGIIIGFVLAFSVFAFASKKLILAFGIDISVIRNASLILLFLFGLVLLSGKLSQKFSTLTQGAASFGTNLSNNGKDGLLSGIIIGCLIGLVWTPCAGPILAAVLVQVIRQETDTASIFVILSFATGAGIPMLIIALTGRKIMGKLGFFTKHAEAVRKTFGIIIIAAVAFIASGVDAQSLFSKQVSLQSASNSSGIINGLEQPYDAPELAGIQKWLNSNPLTLQKLKGKVVLIDFWTYSCINCIRTLPYVTSWDEKYRDKGLVIIGIQAPEFEFEKNADNVQAALIKHNIKYPVALDNNLDTWAAFHNQYWPAHYLINKEGKVVYTHFGEGEYDVTEHNIQTLLGIDNKTTNVPNNQQSFNSDQTPETYLGYSRAQSFAGEQIHDTDAEYKSPKFIPQDSWTLNGKWNVSAEKITAIESGAELDLNFKANKVFLVLGTKDNTPITATITLNGEPINTDAGKDLKDNKVTIEGHRLYELVSQKDFKNSLITIKADQPGLEAYAFTFGN